MRKCLGAYISALTVAGVGLGALTIAACDFVFEWGDPGDPKPKPKPKPEPEPPEDPPDGIPGSLAKEEVPPIYDRITGKDLIPDLIVDKAAAIKLGKALFWDMQTGSDGQACASCHFAAGADNRARNQLSPGFLGGNGKFDDTRTGDGGPNYTLLADDFPFHVKQDPKDRDSQVKFDTDDVTSSQGVINTAFTAVVPGQLADTCETVPDPLFQEDGINLRRVEPRNAPTAINAAFFFRNFWDGRANRIFNGVSPFGRRDKDAFILEIKDHKPVKRKIELVNASLASQAVGPILSDFEASCGGRGFPDVARKLLRAPTVPLAFQRVHADDSVLGDQDLPAYGLNTTYEQLIKQAFADKLWKSDAWFDEDKKLLKDPDSLPDDKRFTLMEANFSLVWGLAILMYESTLIAADTPFDRYRDGRDPKALGPRELAGLDVFMNQGKCVNCHKTAMFSSASTLHLIPEDEEGGLVERMLMSEEHFHYAVITDPPVKLHPIELWKPGNNGRTLKLDVEATPTAKGGGITPGPAEGHIELGKEGDDSVCTYKPLTLTFGADDSKSRDAEIEAVRTGGVGCPTKLKIAIRDDVKVGADNWLDLVMVEDSKGVLQFVGYANAARIELRQPALYDNGFYNIGVRPTQEDIGVGGVDPFGHPLSFTAQYVQMLLGKDVPDPFDIDPCRFEVPWNTVVDDPLFPGGFKDQSKCDGALKVATGVPKDNKDNKRAIQELRTAVRGAFKTPTLRNVQLTAPFMHNGGMSTLEQVVEFYNRGGDFHRNKELDPDITKLGLSKKQQEDLVLFLKSLTDPNVVYQRAPFDHPELFVPRGLDKVEDDNNDGRADEDLFKDGLKLPAVGKNGSSTPIDTFLDLEKKDLPPPP